MSENVGTGRLAGADGKGNERARTAGVQLGVARWHGRRVEAHQARAQQLDGAECDVIGSRLGSRSHEIADYSLAGDAIGDPHFGPLAGGNEAHRRDRAYAARAFFERLTPTRILGCRFQDEHVEAEALEILGQFALQRARRDRRSRITTSAGALWLWTTGAANRKQSAIPTAQQMCPFAPRMLDRQGTASTTMANSAAANVTHRRVRPRARRARARRAARRGSWRGSGWRRHVLRRCCRLAVAIR